MNEVLKIHSENRDEAKSSVSKTDSSCNLINNLDKVDYDKKIQSFRGARGQLD